ncbi:MAG: hypothetical protein AAGH89_08840 [Verrucomicrobiota bacterium]
MGSFQNTKTLTQDKGGKTNKVLTNNGETHKETTLGEQITRETADSTIDESTRTSTPGKQTVTQTDEEVETSGRSVTEAHDVTTESYADAGEHTTVITKGHRGLKSVSLTITFSVLGNLDGSESLSC